MMSRPIPRVIFLTVIAAVLLAAAYLTAQGAIAKSDAGGVQAHVVNGLKTNLNHDRSTVVEQQALRRQSETYTDPGVQRHGGGGCESELRSSPLD